MKRIIYILATGFTFCLAAAACSSVKKQNNMQTSKNNSIKGTVEQVQRGKDGYTALIKTTAGQLYYVTISHANLKDPAQYRETAIGAVIEVQGDAWDNGEEHHITVRELKAKP